MTFVLVGVLALALAIAGAVNGRTVPRAIVAFFVCGGIGVVLPILIHIDHVLYIIGVVVAFFVIMIVMLMIAPNRSIRSFRWGTLRMWAPGFFTGLGIFLAAQTGAWISDFQPLSAEPQIPGTGVGASFVWVSGTTVAVIGALNFHNQSTPGYAPTNGVEPAGFWQAWSRMIALGVVALVLIGVIVVSSIGIPSLSFWTPRNTIMLAAMVLIPLVVWLFNHRSPDWWQRPGGRASRLVAVVVAIAVAVTAGQLVTPPDWQGTTAAQWFFLGVLAFLAGGYFTEDIIANALLNFEKTTPVLEPLRRTTVLGALVLGAFGGWIVLTHVGLGYGLNGTPASNLIWSNIVVGTAQLAVLVWSAAMVGALTDRPEANRRKTVGSVRASMTVDSMMGSWLIFAIAVATSEVLCRSGAGYIIVGAGVLVPTYGVVREAWRGHMASQDHRVKEGNVPDKFITRLDAHARFQKAVVLAAPVLIGAMAVTSLTVDFAATP